MGAVPSVFVGSVVWSASVFLLSTVYADLHFLRAFCVVEAIPVVIVVDGGALILACSCHSCWEVGVHGAEFLARLFGEEEAGHLGHHIHFLAAHGVTHGQVQEDFAVQINLCAIISHKTFGCCR